MRNLMQIPGARLLSHAIVALVVWRALMAVTGAVDPLTNYYIAMAGMYVTALFGMVILVGLSGQVSLGNGALMAVGGYAFALTSLHWPTVPFTSIPWNGTWSMVAAAAFGALFGWVVGIIGARLSGPYLAGLTLGIAVGVPAIATRFPEMLGGESGLMLTVPYPEGGYHETTTAEQDFGDGSLVTDQSELVGEDTGEELTADTFPTGEAAGEELTADTFPTGEAAGEELTADTFPTAEATGGELTADTFPTAEATGGELTADTFPTAEATPIDDGSLGTDDSLGGIGEFVIEQWQASLSIAVAAIALFVALNLIRGRQGLIWQAVRDNSVAAAVVGINPGRAKVAAFTLSSMFAALSGAVLAQILAYIGPGAFGLGLSLSLLVGVVLGGRASLVGAVIGAVLLVWLPEFVLSLAGDRGWDDQITNNAANLVYGLLVVLVVLIAPGGLVGTMKSGFNTLTRRK